MGPIGRASGSLDGGDDLHVRMVARGDDAGHGQTGVRGRPVGPTAATGPHRTAPAEWCPPSPRAGRLARDRTPVPLPAPQAPAILAASSGPSPVPEA